MAKSDRGWIKLHRKIQDNELWLCNEPFGKRDAWIDLLLMANHEERTIIINGQRKVIKAGQHWTSFRILATRWHWSYERVRRYFKLLDESGMATVSVTPNGSLVTIENYGFYQGERVTKRDTNERTDDGTDDRTDDVTDERQTRMNNNYKNYKKNEEETRVRAEGLSEGSFE